MGGIRMNHLYHCYASAAFGMEGLVSKELKSIGLHDVEAGNGFVLFSATGKELFLANMELHFSDRLYIILASGECKSFEDLFQLVSSVRWADYFSRDDFIDISCKCTRSQLMSQRDCQSITKKAIIENVKKETGQSTFPESGSALSVHVSVRNDLVRILLNTSGEALSRRGYRTWNGEAPLRETLAAALVELSGWKPGQPLHDPCCGTGTILIESALKSGRIAPGINRQFAMEKYKCFQGLGFASLRASLKAMESRECISGISGSDLDPEALELAKRHIAQAGLDSNTIHLEHLPLQELNLDAENGVFITLYFEFLDLLALTEIRFLNNIRHFSFDNFKVVVFKIILNITVCARMEVKQIFSDNQNLWFLNRPVVFNTAQAFKSFFEASYRTGSTVFFNALGKVDHTFFKSSIGTAFFKLIRTYFPEYFFQNIDHRKCK